MGSLFRQDVVSTAHVMVVGCGALGNEVLKNLVLMGVRHLVVVDFDVVEADNLTRSVFFAIDDAKAGRKKALVIAERLQKMNPATEVQAICGDIAYDVGLGLICRMDVVIGCVDNRWARYCINRLCMRAGKPWVDGGIDHLEGTARVFMPGENCYACSLGPEGLRDLAFRLPCAGTVRRDMESGKVPTTSIAASIIAAVQVQEALKLICKKQMNQDEASSLCGKMFYYEGMHLSTRLVSFKAYDEDCPVHEQWEPVVQTTITSHDTVAEVLDELGQTLHTDTVSFSLVNDCFVDWLTRRDEEKRVSVMLPGHCVTAWLESEETLSGVPLSALLQHEYRIIDSRFPYQELSLRQLGIPEEDILCVQTPVSDRYIQLKS